MAIDRRSVDSLMSLLAFVRRTIRRHHMIPSGGRVVVALSGGPDSVALLHLLRDLEAGGDLVVAGVAHFNHQLRAAADDDERFCRELAAALALPIDVDRADVRMAARSAGRSVEDMARQLRYGFLHEAAVRRGADAIAVGHSRDDQAETFVLRILRGAGTRGLGAIRPKAGKIIRPLIDVPRADLRTFAAERNLAFREDETNADVSIPRNRVRHELLPSLEREFSPNIVEVLAREAALAAIDEDRLQMEAIDLAGSIVLTDTHTGSADRIGPSAQRVTVDAAALAAVHPALASRVARLALRRIAADRFIGFDHVQRFLDFVREGATGSALSLPGQQARIVRSPAAPHGRMVVLEPADTATRIRTRVGNGGRVLSSRAGEVRNSFHFSLSIPGEVVLAQEGWLVTAEWADAEAAGSAAGDALVALVKGLDGPLTVRSRQPGDRFSPAGLGGRARKLQDFMVDRKIARSDRDLLPLVVDRDDRIVWIVGHAVAEGFRAVTPSTGVILLKARHLGGEV
jgi:tRNA(Ile)-lysidine synthase